MPTLIQELSEQEDYTANNTWLLVEQNGTLYKVKADAFLDTYSLQSEHLDVKQSTVTFQSTSLSFDKTNLLSELSSFILNLEFGYQSQFPGVTIIKNSGETFCSVLTFENSFQLQVGSVSDVLKMSTFSTQDGRQTNVSAVIDLASNDLISLTSLKLENVSSLSGVSSAYCSARINARVYS